MAKLGAPKERRFLRWRGLVRSSSSRSTVRNRQSCPPVHGAEVIQSRFARRRFHPASSCEATCARERNTSEKGNGTHHLEEEVPEPLLFGRQTGVGLDADEEPALEVGELVEVDEERVDLVLRQDVVHLQLALVVLFGPVPPESADGAEKGRMRERRTHLQHLEVLHVLALRIEDLAHDERALVRRSWLRLGGLGVGGWREEDALRLEEVEQLGDRVDDL